MRISKAYRLISSAVADASSFVYSFVHGVKPFAHNLTFLDSDVVHVHLAVRLRGLALHPLGDGDDLLGLGHESLSVLGLRVEAAVVDGVAVRLTAASEAVVAPAGPVGAAQAALLVGHDDHLLGAEAALAVKLHAAEHTSGVINLQLGHSRAEAALDSIRGPVKVVHVDVVVESAAAADRGAVVVEGGVGLQRALADIKVGTLLVEVRTYGRAREDTRINGKTPAARYALEAAARVLNLCVVLDGDEVGVRELRGALLLGRAIHDGGERRDVLLRGDGHGSHGLVMNDDLVGGVNLRR